MKLRSIPAILLAALSSSAWAGAAADAQTLYNNAQAVRENYSTACEGKSCSDAELAKHQKTLEASLIALASPDVRALAEGNIYLAWRPMDTLYDLAVIRARRGDSEGALAALDELQHRVWNPAYREMMLKESAFASLKADPRFTRLLAVMAISARLRDTPSLATPYRAELPLAERSAGVALLWAEARQNFVWFDSDPELDWDKVLLDTLAEVVQNGDTTRYYRSLQKMLSRLHDGHSKVFPPEELSDRFYARPPLRTELIEDRIVLTALFKPELAQRIALGDELIAIDGLPARTYAESEVRPYIGASSPQDSDYRTFGSQLLAGDPDKPLKLRFRRADGREVDVSVRRKDPDAKLPTIDQQLQWRDGDIAYLDMRQLGDDTSPKALKKDFDKLQKARGLILDLRNNNGGSTNFGTDVLQQLTRERLPEMQSSFRDERQSFRTQPTASMPWFRLPPENSGAPEEQAGAQTFSGPVIMLIGTKTFSAGEDTAAIFRLSQRGLLIGEATGGSTGQPLQLKLPGGGEAIICAKRDSYPDGSDFVGKGVQPDVLIKPSVADIRAGRDPVLAKAIALIRSGETKPVR